ncbi:histidine kinase [Acinetobacter qingfengensis]|uniref:Histidine kinase n=1 Tax=Acinetobacter qingfengensis TaxID=1262585 RepID=A0A1E7R5B3_9GAMM|nr:cache domain-containing protein [Acinetobacter qingfengensis]KAA8732475.1 histidine kinase [Acinetobacter qingfengensis]OEY94492.1 histidine kinase [Acinetobacter qingfengensis]
MIKNLNLEKLDFLVKQVFQETISIAQSLAMKASHIISKQSTEQYSGIKLSDQQRHELQLEIKQSLCKSHYSYGMGFASYRPAMDEEGDYWTLEWWFKKDNILQQANLENYQNAQRFLDFRYFDWFQQPEINKKLYIQGPYVDYICNGAYTITTAYPVIVQGQFIGVIAIDLLVSSLEKLFLPCLKAIKETAVIINDNSRVLTSNAFNVRTGSLINLEHSKLLYHYPDQPFQVIVF